MKVEFYDSYNGATELRIEATEFLKAEHNEIEFNSFANAVEAFVCVTGLEFRPTMKEFSVVLGHLDKSSEVIVVVREGHSFRDMWVEFFVSTNNRAKQVIYMEDGAYRYVVGRIPKRDKAEELRERKK